MFRLLANVLLWLTGLIMPVMIACAYGMQYKFSKQGKVVDAQTQAGIPGIAVDCLLGEAETYEALTDADGFYEIWYNEPCDNLRARDPDGAENGGSYAEQTVPWCEACETVVIELTKE
jgi:hypothetical protein